MSCLDIAYPYLAATGHHKYVGAAAAGALCTTVIVRSNLVEVPIETIPTEDDKGRGTPGLTQFCREYPESAPLTVTLTAPDEHNEVPFQKWIINGEDQPAGQEVVSFEVDGECVIAYAKYGGDIIIIECPQIELPTHLLVSLTSTCEVINNTGHYGWGLNCLPQVWRAQGLSLTVVYDESSGVWVGERFIRTCPVRATPDPMHLCPDNDCSEVIPVPDWGDCFQDCFPCGHATINLWATKMEAAFAIECACNNETNTVTVGYGMGFTKDACRSVWYHSTGPPPDCCCGRWHCHILNNIAFRPQYDNPEPRTAAYDGTQEGCDATVEWLARRPFQTDFTLVAYPAAPLLPPLMREMRCTGTIRVG